MVSSFPMLPLALMAFLLASPILSTPTTPNDPFHALSIQKPKELDPPICCLTPLPPVEPVEDDVLLSFEEWKAKQFAMQAQAKAKAKEKESSIRLAASQGASGTVANSNNHGEVRSFEPEPAAAAAPSPSPSAEPDGNTASELLSPHFRVPLTDRFNYASLDCSARVHTAHRSAKSSSSILSSKKDRYMLSPCGSSNGESQFVVVELCEDIRIDTVQLANFEFFSGVFKDFTVSVAKTMTYDAEAWTVAGTYKAKNVRGVQSFHPPTSLRDFYRYIRIDFHSHYSNEFYCPVSLLRVYGLTHLEQWKWDIWESESRAKLEEADAASTPVEVVDAPEPAQAPAADGSMSETLEAKPSTDPNSFPGNATKQELDDYMDSLEAMQPPSTIPSTPNITNALSVVQESTETVTSSASSSNSALITTDGAETAPSQARQSRSLFRNRADGSTSSKSGGKDDTTPEVTRQATAVDSPSSTAAPSSPREHTSSTAETSTIADDHTSSTHMPTSSDPTSTNTTHTVNSSFLSRISSSFSGSNPASSSVPLPHPPSVPPAPTGGESIYRTIMNRLTALESNHTLYARYVEEQTAGVRDTLKKLGEEVGRLEGIGKAQAQMYQRTVKEWERQKQRLEMEHGELMSRVDYLADEVVLEKRLGIAQLCLLLAVLIFMGITRGSRGESVFDHGIATARLNKSMREWSRRHLSFNSDWANRFRSRSPTPQPSARSPDMGKDKVEFPKSRAGLLPPFTSRTPIPADQARRIRDMHTSASERRPTPINVTSPGKRSRTPTALRTPTRHLGNHHRPVTPTSSHNPFPRPHLHRANSHGATGGSQSFVGPVPKSAKKWAKSSHLHEVRGRDDKDIVANGSRGQDRGRDRHGRENEFSDVFRSPISPFKGYSANQPVTVGDALKLLDKGKGPRGRRPFSPLPNRRHSLDTDDSEMWVDTDVDGSEYDHSTLDD